MRAVRAEPTHPQYIVQTWHQMTGDSLLSLLTEATWTNHSTNSPTEAGLPRHIKITRAEVYKGDLLPTRVSVLSFARTRRKSR